MIVVAFLLWRNNFGTLKKLFVVNFIRNVFFSHRRYGDGKNNKIKNRLVEE